MSAKHREFVRGCPQTGFADDPLWRWSGLSRFVLVSHDPAILSPYSTANYSAQGCVLGICKEGWYR